MRFDLLAKCIDVFQIRDDTAGSFADAFRNTMKQLGYVPLPDRIFIDRDLVNVHYAMSAIPREFPNRSDQIRVFMIGVTQLLWDVTRTRVGSTRLRMEIYADALLKRFSLGRLDYTDLSVDDLTVPRIRELCEIHSFKPPESVRVADFYVSKPTQRKKLTTISYTCNIADSNHFSLSTRH